MTQAGFLHLACGRGDVNTLPESPLNAAACVMAGLPLTVALCGSAYAHPEHFAGLSTVILALDSDAVRQQEGRRRLWLELVRRGVEVLALPTTSLGGCKDLSEYWQQYRTMPTQLLGRVLGLHGLSPDYYGRENAPRSN